jgi:tRNA threonylcarbamoyladenosine biosynthesis protein TsaB
MALARETMLLEKGHAEELVPMLDRVMARVEGGFKSLNRIAVTIGPGSFTGMRVGLSSARAAGVALGIPVVGVSTLSAYLAPMMREEAGRVMVAAIDARHKQVYLQALVHGGRPLLGPKIAPVREVVRELGSASITLSGSGAPLLAAELWSVGLDVKIQDASPCPDIAWVARLGCAADPALAPATPLYLKAPDAHPQQNGRLARQ